MRSSLALILALLAACSSSETVGAGSSLPPQPTTAATALAQQCTQAGIPAGTASYQRCYAGEAQRQNAGAGGVMDMVRTITPIGALR
jgi:hypothetical protein